MTYLTLDRMWDVQRADFMRLAFATGPSANGDTPYAERFLHDFEQRNCYDRFYHEGSETSRINTRFLLSGHALTVVADGTSPELEDNERGLLGQFRHQYFLLFLIGHFHRAALLMLSDRLVAAIKRLEIRSARSAAEFRRETYRLQESFMRFTQRYWFTDISDQAQTRDLFRLQRTHLGNEDLYKELRNEIFDMVQYLDSDVLRRQSGTIHRLTAVTILGSGRHHCHRLSRHESDRRNRGAAGHQGHLLRHRRRSGRGADGGSCHVLAASHRPPGPPVRRAPASSAWRKYSSFSSISSTIG